MILLDCITTGIVRKGGRERGPHEGSEFQDLHLQHCCPHRQVQVPCEKERSCSRNLRYPTAIAKIISAQRDIIIADRQESMPLLIENEGVSSALAAEWSRRNKMIAQLFWNYPTANVHSMRSRMVIRMHATRVSKWTKNDAAFVHLPLLQTDGMNNAHYIDFRWPFLCLKSAKTW